MITGASRGVDGGRRAGARNRRRMPEPVLAGGHEPRFAEVRQVPGHLRLRGADDPNEVTHAQFSNAQKL